MTRIQGQVNYQGVYERAIGLTSDKEEKLASEGM
jgi:hypothetical protein